MLKRIFTKFALAFLSMCAISGCSSKSENVKYEYPLSRDQREAQRVGLLGSEPIYLVKPKSGK